MEQHIYTSVSTPKTNITVSLWLKLDILERNEKYLNPYRPNMIISSNCYWISVRTWISTHTHLHNVDLFYCIYPSELIGYDDQRRGISQKEAPEQHSNMQGGDGETVPGAPAACVWGNNHCHNWSLTHASCFFNSASQVTFITLDFIQIFQDFFPLINHNINLQITLCINPVFKIDLQPVLSWSHCSY